VRVGWKVDEGEGIPVIFAKSGRNGLLAIIGDLFEGGIVLYIPSERIDYLFCL